MSEAEKLAYDFDPEQIEVIRSSEGENVKGYSLPKKILLAVIDWNTENRVQQMLLDECPD